VQVPGYFVMEDARQTEHLRRIYFVHSALVKEDWAEVEFRQSRGMWHLGNPRIRLGSEAGHDHGFYVSLAMGRFKRDLDDGA
jgi:hypothetical protein